MHKIYKLVEQLDFEIETATDYIHCMHKSDGDIKDKYKELAEDELEHVETLIEIGDEYNFGKSSDENAQTIWDFEKSVYKMKHAKLKVELSQID